MGIVVDNKLKFEKHAENIFQKASKKLNVLAIVTNHMEAPKSRILMNAFFKAQFNYRPAVWIFHNRSLNNKTNRLHERYLRIICNDKHSNFEEMLVKDNSVSIHHNNIHALSNIKSETKKLHYNMRNTSQFLVDTIHSVFNGSESALYLGSKV